MGNVSSREVAEGMDKEPKENNMADRISVSEEEEPQIGRKFYGCSSQVTPINDRKAQRPSVTSRKWLSFCRWKIHKPMCVSVSDPDTVDKESEEEPEVETSSVSDSKPQPALIMVKPKSISDHLQKSHCGFEKGCSETAASTSSSHSSHAAEGSETELDIHMVDDHIADLQRSCESCAEVPDSSHWVLVKPEASTEKSISTYSLSSPAGSYECSVSGLRWSCAAPVTLQYRFRKEELFWTQLQMLQYQPAGPLMDIKLLSGKLEEIHLPHSLCLGGSDLSLLENAVRALHSDGSDTGVPLETCKLTRFHGRIPVDRFSMWQMAVSLGIPVRSHCEVLIYQSCTQPLILNTFLVPTPSTVRKAVEKRWRRQDIRSISKPPPNESLLVNSKFQLRIFGSSSEIIPSEVTLSYKTSPTYFEVCLEKPPKDFEMELSPAGENQTVWKAVMRQGADYRLTEDQVDSRMSLDSLTDAEAFVDKHRAELIQRVTCVMPIADVLLSKRLLNHEKYSKIEVAATNQDKMRKIYNCLNSAGAKGKAAFYDALKQEEPHLIENLTGAALQTGNS